MGQTLWQGLLLDLQLVWIWRGIGGPVSGSGTAGINTNWAVGHTINIGSHMVNQFTMGEMDSYLVNYGFRYKPSIQTSLGLSNVFTNLPTVAAYLSQLRL